MSSKTVALIQRYENGPGDLIASLDGLSDKDLDRRPEPKKWTIRQQVHHLTDAELNLVSRMKKIIAEDNPLLIAFDQDKWADSFLYTKTSVEDSIALFYTLRASMTPILKSLKENDFARTGVHNQTGKVTMMGVLEYTVEHFEHHLKAIEKTKRKYKIK
jgi:DinB superfamily